MTNKKNNAGSSNKDYLRDNMQQVRTRAANKKATKTVRASIDLTMDKFTGAKDCLADTITRKKSKKKMTALKVANQYICSPKPLLRNRRLVSAKPTGIDKA